MKRSEMRWYSTKIFSKLFFISLLLHHSLGYSFLEDDYPEAHPAFYQYLEDGMWSLHQKIPRGYMVPVPRVGRRHIHETKRQNMIPQPRIGRQLELDSELANVIDQIHNFMQKVEHDLPSESFDVESNIQDKTHSSIFAEDVECDILPKSTSTKEMSDLFLRNKGSTKLLKNNDETSILNSKDNKQISDDGRTLFISISPHVGENILKSQQKNSGFDLFEDEKRQGGLIPAVRLGRDIFLTSPEDTKSIGNMIAYPRMDRRFWELHRTLIPYPRAGRFTVDPESLDYDILLNPNYGTSDLEDTLTDAFLNTKSVQKRKIAKLIPRIGRKKRSISENSKKEDEAIRESDQKLSNVDNGRAFWSNLDDFDQDYIFGADKKGMRNKSGFVPRVGKKSSDDDEYYEEKRAMAFTPRVGRAALIPRIGRNDPRFRLMSRGAFIPRIGRAAFIPRVGRSSNQPNKKEKSN